MHAMLLQALYAKSDGDYTKAEHNARRAVLCNVINIVGGIITTAIVFVFGVVFGILY